MTIYNVIFKGGNAATVIEGPAQVTVRNAYLIIPGGGLTPIFHVVHDEFNGRILD